MNRNVDLHKIFFSERELDDYEQLIYNTWHRDFSKIHLRDILAINPKFILLDEPFAGIDPIAVEDIQAIVAKMKYKNIGVLITDHNVTETLSICDRAYLLIEGKIFKHGTAEELAADDDVRRYPQDW